MRIIKENKLNESLKIIDKNGNKDEVVAGPVTKITKFKVPINITVEGNVKESCEYSLISKENREDVLNFDLDYNIDTIEKQIKVQIEKYFSKKIDNIKTIGSSTLIGFPNGFRNYESKW